jgi:hypothetical protein
MARLIWVETVSTTYSYELSEEELQQYQENEEEFFKNADILGNGEVLHEKIIESDFEFDED